MEGLAVATRGPIFQTRQRDADPSPASQPTGLARASQGAEANRIATIHMIHLPRARRLLL
jgi:hypothetical protein